MTFTLSLDIDTGTTADQIETLLEQIVLSKQIQRSVGKYSKPPVEIGDGSSLKGIEVYTIGNWTIS